MRWRWQPEARVTPRESAQWCVDPVVSPDTREPPPGPWGPACGCAWFICWGALCPRHVAGVCSLRRGATERDVRSLPGVGLGPLSLLSSLPSRPVWQLPPTFLSHLSLQLMT